MITWARTGAGYEVSSKGDRRFSALYAEMPDCRTIEMWYQLDVKGYGPGGTKWKIGKGKPPILPYPEGQLWLAYLGLWRLWAVRNPRLMNELRFQVGDNGLLTDCFATTEINQAHALATILNEWVIT